jgi:hypothetical protein
MPPIQVGTVFGRLTVIAEVERAPWGHRRWLSECECGNKSIATQPNLRSGKTLSCGCFHRELTILRNTTHGHSFVGSVSPEYSIWLMMKDRCFNPKSKGFKNYGGRGITVCAAWAKNYETFLHDMGERPSPDFSVERIDNSRGYEPANCKWGTRIEQATNTRRNVLVTYAGSLMPFSEAARRAGVSYKSARSRRDNGWPESEWFLPSGQPKSHFR